MQFATTPCLGAADEGNGGYSSQGTPTGTLDGYPISWVGRWVTVSDFVSLLTQTPQRTFRVHSNAGWGVFTLSPGSGRSPCS